MVSFLTKCAQCGATIAKDTACPDCHWSESPDDDVMAGDDSVILFAERERIHRRNYAVFMLLSFATGLIGLLTAVCWVMVIYRGNLLAFVSIGLFTVLTGVMAAALFFANRLLPVDLNCPNCETRLDELGPVTPLCPSCGTQLK